MKPKEKPINKDSRELQDIYESFSDGRETRSVFLNISKAFHKFSHENLLYKLKKNDISGNLLNIITDFCVRENKRLGSTSRLMLKQDSTRNLFLKHYSFRSI